MNQRSVRPVVQAAAAILCLAIAGPASAEDAPSKQYRKAFEFTYEDVNPNSPTRGEKVSLHELYAPEGLVLNFIASWCPPCWQELPSFAKIDAEVSTPVVFIAADEMSGARDLLVRLGQTQVSQPVLLVPRAEIAMLERHYDHEMLPSTYVIGSSGEIRQVFEGMISEGTLVRALEVHFPESGADSLPSKPRPGQAAVSF